MDKGTQFLSCDWGTTAFRLRLVAAAGFKILAESSSKQGTAGMYESWCRTGRPEEARAAFYRAVIEEHLKNLEAKSGHLPDDIPVIISGMASSNIGMAELPYKELPFALDGSDLEAKLIPASDDFRRDILLISGVKSADDVMRGEETQVVGCVIGTEDEEQLIVHPGTHCKHIVVKGGHTVSFKTYMTGEFFSLLSGKSILASSVKEGASFDVSESRKHFEAGVRDAQHYNLLHAAFLVRTGDLFKKRSKEESWHYLSGLLIGSELHTFPKDYRGVIILAGEAALVAQYRAAMDICGIAGRVAKIILKDADEITMAGQYAVYQHHQKK